VPGRRASASRASPRSPPPKRRQKKEPFHGHHHPSYKNAGRTAFRPSKVWTTSSTPTWSPAPNPDPQPNRILLGDSLTSEQFTVVGLTPPASSPRRSTTPPCGRHQADRRADACRHLRRGQHHDLRRSLADRLLQRRRTTPAPTARWCGTPPSTPSPRRPLRRSSATRTCSSAAADRRAKRLTAQTRNPET
jgi:hypothetical protein